MIFYDKYKLSLKKCINAAVCVNGFLNIGLYGSVKSRLPSSRPQYTAGIHTRRRKLNGENNKHHGEQRAERHIQRPKNRLWQQKWTKWRCRWWSSGRSFGKLMKSCGLHFADFFVFHETWEVNDTCWAYVTVYKRLRLLLDLMSFDLSKYWLFSMNNIQFETISCYPGELGSDL